MPLENARTDDRKSSYRKKTGKLKVLLLTTMKLL
jgi:hypothetical protein